MSEEENLSPRLRMIFIVLALTNLLFLVYAILFPDNVSTAAKRIEELQINPGRIKLMGTATRGPAGQGGVTSKSTAYRACLEWGPFSGLDLGRAESALTRLALAQPIENHP